MPQLWILTLLLSFITAAVAATQPGWYTYHGLTSQEYQSKHDELVAQSFRPTYISGYTVRNKELYTCVFEKIEGPRWISSHNITGPEYDSEFDKKVNQGYRLVFVNGYAGRDGLDKYSWVWEMRSSPSWVSYAGIGRTRYEAEYSKRLADGYRLTHLSGFEDYPGGEARFAAIWEKSPGPKSVSKVDMTTTTFERENERLSTSGYSLDVISAYEIKGALQYAAIWLLKSEVDGLPQLSKWGLTSEEYHQQYRNNRFQGYRARTVLGYPISRGDGARYAYIYVNQVMKRRDLLEIDRLIKDFTTKYSVPGISLAITRNESLVFAKGAGFSDRKKKTLVHPDNLFRVASVSKTMTAIAIFTLIDKNKIKLDSKVFGENAILGTRYGSNKAYSEVMRNISVQHLLEHTSGYSYNVTNGEETDPTYQQLDLGVDQLISSIMDNRRLLRNTPPGSKFFYSNFGYMLLGRIIEQVSGQKYSDYVRENVFRRAGVTKMKLAASEEADRADDEVTYYPGPNNGAVYGKARINIERRDSAGGWIARPIDLLSILTRVDFLPAKEDNILSAKSQTEMYDSSTVPGSSYARGWRVNRAERWHTGSREGTNATLTGRTDGIAYAVVINTRTDGPQSLGELMDSIVAAVGNRWPDHDLF
ncbi:hypothetical protein EPUS_04781 [Endocarpon pusillum Z07020]|uniref:Beta-lactamase-related domain-containing protein n=1 Tax=Endocarpon pusillum (strain Z07020 / HMAS-L-300199) TaxID=1263415 RepID=U1GKK5_ENDPU|nr:uncharacterized protein EPUS_04781 [Endocarpon pusillum Z07020]ERF72728.1 hypothetical protein EPUS_04781 [Endocarpon pusillum Z07020]